MAVRKGKTTTIILKPSAAEPPVVRSRQNHRPAKPQVPSNARKDAENFIRALASVIVESDRILSRLEAKTSA